MKKKTGITTDQAAQKPTAGCRASAEVLKEANFSYRLTIMDMAIRIVNPKGDFQTTEVLKTYNELLTALSRPL